MASSTNMGLIGLPLVCAVFAVLLNNNAFGLVFATIGSLAAAVATTAAISVAGGIQIFGSGVDIKDFSIKLTFVTTFLTVFYASNIILGLNLIISIPMGFGLIITGVLTTMYVFGMFGIASVGAGN
jgi:hypothetical protein